MSLWNACEAATGAELDDACETALAAELGDVDAQARLGRMLLDVMFEDAPNFIGFAAVYVQKELAAIERRAREQRHAA